MRNAVLDPASVTEPSARRSSQPNIVQQPPPLNSPFMSMRTPTIFDCATAGGRFVLNSVGRNISERERGLLFSSPIVPAADRLLVAMERESRVLFQAPTGSGKSTMLPGILMEDGYSVVVLEPRRILVEEGAKQLSRFYAQEPGPKSVVGWGHGYDARNQGKSNNCKFFTTGYFLNKLLGVLGNFPEGEEKSPISSKTAIIFDEWHERSTDQTFAYEELRELQERMLRAGLTPFRIILCSATLPLDDIYSEGVPLVETRQRARGRPRIETIEASPGQFDEIVLDLATRNISTLVHCAAKPETEMTADRLRTRMMDVGAPVFEVVTLHSKSPKSDCDLAISLPAQGIPRVICSTKGRTGVNLPVRAVIDRAVTRRTRYLDDHGCNLLTYEDATKKEIEQGRGRIGRIPLSIQESSQPDLYYYLGRKPVADLADFPPVEADTADLSCHVLNYCAAGHDLVKLVGRRDIKPARLEAAIARLELLGLFSPQDNLTKIGHLAAAIPLDILLRKLVAVAMLDTAQGLQDGRFSTAALVDLTVAAAAVIQSEGIVRPDLHDEKPWLRHSQEGLSSRHEKTSDLAAQLFAYLRYRRPNNMPSDKQLEESGILAASFKRAYDCEQHLRLRLNELRERVHEYEDELATVLRAIKPAASLESVSCSMLARYRTEFTACVTKALAPYAYFRSWGGRDWTGLAGNKYQIPRTSVIRDNADPQLVVAFPRAVQDEDGEIRYWLDFATSTTPALLNRAIHAGNKQEVEALLKNQSKQARHESERRNNGATREGAGWAAPRCR